MVGLPRPGGTGLPCHGTAYCHSAKLCVLAARAFGSQQLLLLCLILFTMRNYQTTIQVKENVCVNVTVLMFWWFLVTLNDLAVFRRQNVWDILSQTDIDF